MIDNSEASILSSEVAITVEKRLEPFIGVSKSYSINFHTPLKRSLTGIDRIVTSPGYMAYDSDDVLRKFYIEEIPNSSTGISSILISNGGTNLTKAPTLRIYGDGLGANAYPIITNGKITSVVVDKAGSGYTTASVKAYDSITNTLIESISLESQVDIKTGKLRSFYYDGNNIKKIYSITAGTVYYDTGIVELGNFNPLDIDNDLKILTLRAVPQTTLFNSSKNSIITLDIEDSAAVSISTVQVSE
jgi:hypothetical protein